MSPAERNKIKLMTGFFTGKPPKVIYKYDRNGKRHIVLKNKKGA